MKVQNDFSNKVLEYQRWLANISLDLFDNYSLVNPFALDNKIKVNEISKIFYKKYYSDNNQRYLIIGSSPARKGTSVTGIPFEDAVHLYSECGIKIEGFYINKTATDFLYDVMELYGGCEKFYKDFYMSFVCPLGITNKSEKGNLINSNYYENKRLRETLYDFIVEALKKQISFGINTSVCFCIGSGENFKFLESINDKYHFFDKIVALEHPRFIMQYNSKDRDKYLNKYLEVLKNK